MPSITTQGIVLRYANYREHDRMLTILSPDYGRIDALSRGCRRPKSPLMPVSELFVSGEFVLYQSHDHFTLTSCALADSVSCAPASGISCAGGAGLSSRRFAHSWTRPASSVIVCAG